MSGKRLRRFDRYWDSWYPAVISLVLVVVFLLVGFNPRTPNADKIVDASINLASIVIGLLGALLGILISVKDAKMIDFIFRSIHRDVVYRYIKQSVFAGFLTIAFAAISYIDVGNNSKETWIWTCVFGLWLFSVVFLLVSSYRIIDMLMYLLANKDVSFDRPPTVKLDQDEVEKLKSQTSRSKQ